MHLRLCAAPNCFGVPWVALVDYPSSSSLGVRGAGLRLRETPRNPPRVVWCNLFEEIKRKRIEHEQELARGAEEKIRINKTDCHRREHGQVSSERLSRANPMACWSALPREPHWFIGRELEAQC